MRHLLISKTNPSSFMALVKAGSRPAQARLSRTRSAQARSTQGLPHGGRGTGKHMINAGLISLLLMGGIVQMAQATHVEQDRGAQITALTQSSSLTPCTGESCRMV